MNGAVLALAAAAAVGAPGPRRQYQRSMFRSGAFTRFICPLCRKSVRVKVPAKTLPAHTSKWGPRKSRNCRASGIEIAVGGK